MKIDKSIPAKFYGGKMGAVQAIIFHYTGNSGTTATAKGNAQYFHNGCPDANGNPRKASAHYIVDTGDTVYQCVPETNAAWAVGDGTGGKYGGKIGNFNSISIEMVSESEARLGYYIPAQTEKNAAKLYWELKKRYPNAIPLRHYDISLKKCPASMVEETAWTAFKELLEEEEDMSGKEIVTRANEYLKSLPCPDWAKAELQEAVDMGITDGSNPCGFIPRFQAAIMAKRAVEKARK